MYNQSNKLRFGYKHANTRAENLFAFSAKYEAQKGKDLCDFSHKELIDVLKALYKENAVSRPYFSLYCTYVNDYTKFMNELRGMPEQETDAVRPWEVLEHRAIVKDEKTAFFSPEVISDYSTILSPKDVFLLYACYEGLRGENGIGMLDLKIDDVDLDQRRVLMGDDVIPISVNCRSAILAAMAEIDHQQTVLPHDVEIKSVAQAKTTIRKMMYYVRDRLGLTGEVLSARNLLTSGLCIDLYTRGYVTSLDNIPAQLNAMKGSLELDRLLKRYELPMDSLHRWWSGKTYLTRYFDLYFEEISVCTTDKEEY